MTEVVLQVKNLTKDYDHFRAVDHISFNLNQGEILGLLGPNGAGKTTTIQMLLTLLEPTSGSIEVFGRDLFKYRELVLQRMNFAATYAALPGNLLVSQNLFIFAMLYGVKDSGNKIKELLKLFDLEKFSNARTGFLSSGEQTRLNLAKAFINDPELLLLDEPTASLDPLVADATRSIIKEQARSQNTAILWTSHNMYEIEDVCDRVLFLSHGKIIAEGTPQALKNQYRKDNLEEVFIQLAREPLDGSS